MATRCGFCRFVRVMLLAMLCGLAAAWLAHRFGVDGNGLMLATFAGAIAPLLIVARKHRPRREQDHVI